MGNDKHIGTVSTNTEVDMASCARSSKPQFNKHEYADQSIHTQRDESCQTFDIRLLSSLAGENGVGFSMPCVFIAECADQRHPRYHDRFVVKIFDPRHTDRLRVQMRLPAFDDEVLGQVVTFSATGSLPHLKSRCVLQSRSLLAYQSAR